MGFLQRLSTEQKIFITIGLLTLFGVGYWLFNETNRPQPGTPVADLGRGHVPVGTPIDYNSNPPTSGPHYEVWTRASILDTPTDDRNLIHSLEHGYIIMSYNCDLQNPSVSMVNEASNAAFLATDSAGLSEPFKTQDCTTLKENLTKVFDEKGKRKLIITPRPNLNVPIALTAWTRIEKLTTFDEDRIKAFIDAYRDQGPERTME
jgi:hypothetical protein